MPQNLTFAITCCPPDTGHERTAASGSLEADTAVPTTPHWRRLARDVNVLDRSYALSAMATISEGMSGGSGATCRGDLEGLEFLLLTPSASPEGDGDSSSRSSRTSPESRSGVNPAEISSASRDGGTARASKSRRCARASLSNLNRLDWKLLEDWKPHGSARANQVIVGSAEPRCFCEMETAPRPLLVPRAGFPRRARC